MVVSWRKSQAHSCQFSDLDNLLTQKPSIVHSNSEQIYTTLVNKHAKSFKNKEINLIKRNCIWTHRKDLISNAGK